MNFFYRMNPLETHFEISNYPMGIFSGCWIMPASNKMAIGFQINMGYHQSARHRFQN